LASELADKTRISSLMPEPRLIVQDMGHVCGTHTALLNDEGQDQDRCCQGEFPSSSHRQQ
jgi:hypothetical protein